MNSRWKIGISLIVVILSLFIISNIKKLSIEISKTGNFILIGSYVGLVAGSLSILILLFPFIQQVGKTESVVSEREKKAVEDVEKIKGVLERYGRKKRIDFYAIQAGILDYARDLYDNHPDYLNKLGSMGAYIKDIVTSSDPRKHGTFLRERGERYIIGLFRELGLYSLLKGKV